MLTIHQVPCKGDLGEWIKIKLALVQTNSNFGNKSYKGKAVFYYLLFK